MGIIEFMEFMDFMDFMMFIGDYRIKNRINNVKLKVRV